MTRNHGEESHEEQEKRHPEDGVALILKAHPPMSAISLQGVAEYFMPDADHEKIWEFIEEIQRRHIESNKLKEDNKEV